MSILNVNQIQPVGGGNTITVSASDISASGATITATSFVGSVTGTTSNASGATGDFSIADKIVHTGDTDTAIRFPGADQVSIETGGTQKLLIGSDGKLVHSTSAAETVDFGTSNSSGSYHKYDLGSSGATVGYIGAGSQIVSGSNVADFGIRSQANLVFSSGGDTERFRIDSSGNAKINDGNLVIGTSGHGIDFSATTDTSGMSSELLDDYEEGIHTVAFSASNGGSVTVSSGNDQVSYVKVGNHVTVTGRPVVTSVSSPQGNLRMTLPFTSADLSDAAGRAACALNVRLLNSGYKVGMMSAYLDEGSNLLNFSYGDNNDSQNSAPAIKSGTQIWINISYRTA